MLCLSLRPGEYLTIGDNVVLQYDRPSGDRCKLIFQAPREVPILRGEVRERGGEERPECVFDQPRRYRRELPWDYSKARSLAAVRAQLSRMDGSDAAVQTLRRELDHIFPPEKTE